jgi:hypothetical protein
MVVSGHDLNHVQLMHTMQYAIYVQPVLEVIITLGVMVVSGHAFKQGATNLVLRRLGYVL